MSEYIIAEKTAINANKFICRDKLGKISITNRREKATRFPDAGKAWKTIINQIPKKNREGWDVVTYTTDEVSLPNDPTPQRFKASVDTAFVPEELFDWDRIRKNITESFSEILAYRDRLHSRLSQVEAELCDCEHACEFFKCDAAHGYKLYAMIRERRIKRRHLKNELWKVSSVLGMSYSDIANGSIENTFNQINNQAYEPRVLKELFNDVLQPHTPE